MELVVTETTDSDNRSVLELSGSLDLATRDLLIQKAATGLATADAQALVIDLAGITFCDSSGLGALVQVVGDAQDAGSRSPCATPHTR